MKSATSLALWVCIGGYREYFVKILNIYQKCWLISPLRSQSVWPSPLLALGCPLLETLLSWVSLTNCTILWIWVLDLTVRLNWPISLVFAIHSSNLGCLGRFTGVHTSTALCLFWAWRPPQEIYAKKLLQTIWHHPKMLNIKFFL